MFIRLHELTEMFPKITEPTSGAYKHRSAHIWFYFRPVRVCCSIYLTILCLSCGLKLDEYGQRKFLVSVSFQFNNRKKRVAVEKLEEVVERE